MNGLSFFINGCTFALNGSPITTNGGQFATNGFSFARNRCPFVTKIRELREEFPNLGKAKVRVLLEPWCAEQGIPCPSESTIGRIISRAPDKVVPTRLDSKGRRKTLQRPRRL